MDSNDVLVLIIAIVLLSIVIFGCLLEAGARLLKKRRWALMGILLIMIGAIIAGFCLGVLGCIVWMAIFNTASIATGLAIGMMSCILFATAYIALHK